MRAHGRLGQAGLLPCAENYGRSDVDQYESYPDQCLRVIGPRPDALPAQPRTHGPQRGERGGVVRLLAG
jgi:hypothetical protein